MSPRNNFLIIFPFIMQCNDRKKRKTLNILALLFLVVLVNLSVRWQIGLNCDKM